MFARRLLDEANARPARLHDATRMIGAGIIASFGQFVVDTPSGPFGASRHVTVIGVAFSLALLIGTLACAVATLLGRHTLRVRWTFGLLIAIGIIAFIPTLAGDLGVAGAIVAWQLMVVGRLLATPDLTRGAAPLGEPSGARHGRSVTHLLLLSLFINTAVIGFRVSDLLGSQIVCLVLDVIAIASATVAYRRRWTGPRWLPPVLLIAGLSLALALRPQLGSALAVLWLAQAALMMVALRDGPLFNELVEQFMRRPALLVVSTFALLATSGAMLLTFPAAAAGARIGPLDALFTSVSAACVNGLIVVDTPVAFSPLGELIILLLIQIGGLGIMVLSTFATVMLGGRLTLRGEAALGQVLELGTPGHAYRLVRFIVAATLATEAVGAVLLGFAFWRHGLPIDEVVWRACFHAISAFCNAGFALQSDSIVMFQDDPLALGVIAVLVILGGLGFAVLAWVWSRFVLRQRGRAPVQVRVVLWLSAALLGVGALLYAALEWNASLAGLSIANKLLNAAFQSVTFRSGGFNSVDVAPMRPATILVALGLMFIGAAPGGTGGGIKVTTAAVLAAAIPNLVTPGGGARLFGRSIPGEVLQRAATITVISTATASLALFLLLLTEDAPFEILAFEAVSALATVGLSLGVTASLSAIGKSVIIATMFIGRVGPLTLALALGRPTRSPISYPEARIMVG